MSDEEEIVELPTPPLGQSFMELLIAAGAEYDCWITEDGKFGEMATWSTAWEDE